MNATATSTRITQRAARLLTVMVAVVMATVAIAAGHAIHRGPLLSPTCPSGCTRGHGGGHEKAMRPRPVPVVERTVTVLNPQLIAAGGHDRRALAPAFPPNPIKPPHATVMA